MEGKDIIVKEWDKIVYRCYPNGKVKNIITGNYIKPTPNTQGYLMLNMSYKGKRKGRLLHRVLAELFIENDSPGTKTVVNHLDGNRENNNLSNLEWTTPLGNVTHAIRIGIHKPWQKTEARISAGKEAGKGRRKLTHYQVNAIRAYYKYKKYNQRELAEMYSVARSSISEIVNGNYYKDSVLHC